jgi:tetratricopeptide (TPR) repeat protein
MSGNAPYGAAREEVMVEVRERAHELAFQGLPAAEIERRLDDGLTATEWELLRNIARHEVASARRHRQAPQQELTHALHEPGTRDLEPPPDRRLGPLLGRPLRKIQGHYGLGLIALVIFVAGILLGSALTGGGDEVQTSTSAGKGAAAKRTKPIPSERPGSARRRPARSAAATRAPKTSAPEKQQPARQSAPRRPVDSAYATQLNDRGFRLMSSGSYEQAVPILRRAVGAYSPQSTDLIYAYALYNLARSLRLSGRSREAIPLLERRLRIDNQRETVARELAAARRSARGGAS